MSVVVAIIDKFSPEANDLMCQSLSPSDAYQLDNVARAPTDERAVGFTDVLCDCFCPICVGCLDLPTAVGWAQVVVAAFRLDFDLTCPLIGFDANILPLLASRNRSAST